MLEKSQVLAAAGHPNQQSALKGANVTLSPSAELATELIIANYYHKSFELNSGL